MYTNSNLVRDIEREGALHTPRLVAAFKAIDRKNFVLPEYAHEAYADKPLPIGAEQTISQPYTVAFMLELLESRVGNRVLDIGSGSCYTTALLAHVVGPAGKVFGIERIPELVAFGARNLAKYDFANAVSLQAGGELGLSAEAPFDRILVSASAEELPLALLEQLRVGGLLVICVRHEIWKVTKTGEQDCSIEKYPGFAFVPLIEGV